MPDPAPAPGPQTIPTSPSSLGGAIVAGVVAAAIGAAVWGGITYATGYQIGWMAIGVGFLVGIAVRMFGKGDTPVFGVIGAICALCGCLAGNLLAVAFFMADAGKPFSLAFALHVMFKAVTPIDFLFYGIALYEGYKVSFKHGA